MKPLFQNDNEPANPRISKYWTELNDNNPIHTLARLAHQPVPHGIYHAVSKDTVLVEYHCNKCNNVSELQVNFTAGATPREGCIPFPSDNQFYCPCCSVHHDLNHLKRDVETTFLHNFAFVKNKKISVD